MKRLRLAAMAATALAMIAAGAGTATAAPTEVMKDSTGGHCTPTCTVYFSGQNIKLYAHVPFFGELHRYTCNMRLIWTVNESGTGSVVAYPLPPSSGSSPNPCSEVTVCNGASWPGSIGHNGAGLESLVVTASICTPIVTCTGSLSLPLDETFAGFSSEVSNARIGTTACEIEGGTNHWTTTGEGDLVTLEHL
jgi:hypothetical protein